MITVGDVRVNHFILLLCSYSYDLTHNLQHNMASLIHMPVPASRGSREICQLCADKVKRKSERSSGEGASDRMKVDGGGVGKGGDIRTEKHGRTPEVSEGNEHEKERTEGNNASDEEIGTSGVEREGSSDNAEKCAKSRDEERRTGSCEEEREGTENKESVKAEPGDNSTTNFQELDKNSQKYQQTETQNSQKTNATQRQSADEVHTSETSGNTSHNCESSQQTNTTQGQSAEKPDTSQTSICCECRKLREQRATRSFRKSPSCQKFVWNEYLLKEFEGMIHSDWVLRIVNGFVGQSGILTYK